MRRLRVLFREANGLLHTLHIFEGILIIVVTWPTTGDEKDAEKGQQAPTDELGCLLRCGALEISIQDRAPNDDTV